jgi:hypothetical protein
MLSSLEPSRLLLFSHLYDRWLETGNSAICIQLLPAPALCGASHKCEWSETYIKTLANPAFETTFHLPTQQQESNLGQQKLRKVLSVNVQSETNMRLASDVSWQRRLITIWSKAQVYAVCLHELFNHCILVQQTLITAHIAYRH